MTLPEPMALEETADAIASLAADGIDVGDLIVNRMSDRPRQPCHFCAARRRFEARAIAPLRRRFPRLSDISVVMPGSWIASLAACSRCAGAPRPVARPLVAAARRCVPHRAGAPRHARTRVAVAGCFAKAPTATFFGGRWLLFGGKGGVGKSTCAAAVSLHLAETGRVLLLSTDPAHSLGDVFGQRFDNTPRAVAGVPRLQVREIDAAAEMDRLRRTYVDAVDDAFARIARGAGGDHAALRDLIDLAPPGIDEVIAIADVAAALAGGEGGYDVIVTDTAPTGHALRLLQTPSVLREWTQAVMAILLKYREIVGAGALAALLVQLSKRLRALQDILRDPARARFVVVTRAGGPARRRVARADGRARAPRHRHRRRRRQRGRARDVRSLPEDRARPGGRGGASVEAGDLRYHRGARRSAAAARQPRAAGLGRELAAGQVMSTAVYLYCVVRAARRPSLARTPAGQSGAGRPEIHPVARALWIVTAAVPLDVYGPSQLEPRLRDLDWVSRAALAHEAVVEHFARRRTATVVPMTLFTMFSSVDKAVGDVASRREAIQQAIRRIAGAEEWGVRVFRQALPPASAMAPASGAAFLRARKRA